MRHKVRTGTAVRERGTRHATHTYPMVPPSVSTILDITGEGLCRLELLEERVADVLGPIQGYQAHVFEELYIYAS